MNHKQKYAIVAVALGAAIVASFALSGRRQEVATVLPTENVYRGPVFSLFGPAGTDTPTITPTPTLTSTPDATGHLPIPQVTAATRTYPGDHYATAVAFVQNNIQSGTAMPFATAVSLYAEIWAPTRGDGYGALVEPTNIAGYIAAFGASPQATPRTQGYFLSRWGTPDADSPSQLIAVVTTFWQQATPVAFPTDSLRLDPTAQWVKVIPGGMRIGSDPLVFVLRATSGGTYTLVSLIEGKDGYNQVVKDMQDAGWGPYYTFRTP